MAEVTFLGQVVLLTANILYIICYGLRDVLWLRILAVVAMNIMNIYYFWGTKNADGSFYIQWPCILWQMAFIAVNAYWIVRIIQERRPPTLTADEKFLYDSVFKDTCSPKNMLKLLDVAHWKEASIGTQLIQKDTDLDELLLVREGMATVRVNGNAVAELNPGDLMGEMSFLTRGKTVADVVASGPIRYLAWPREALHNMFEESLELKSAIYHLIGKDLVEKLTESTQSVPELSQVLSSDSHPG